MENNTFKCIANENCGEFEDAREFSYHLVLKHYDLIFLKIDLHCPECKDTYTGFPEFNEHYCCEKGVLNRSKRFCETCNIEFLSHKRFRLHQMFHLPNYRPRICFLCDKVFKIEEDFYDHIMFYHKTKEELKFTCKMCDKVSTSEELYEKHQKSHLKDFVAKCHICSNSYRVRHNLTLHIRHVHHGREHNDCKICGKEFNFKGQLKMHLEDHNELRDGKVFVCSICGLCEPDLESFDDHDHGGKSNGFFDEFTDLVYACEFCERAYIQPSDLKAHREEADHVTYDCDICDEKFERHPYLKNHRLTHDYGDHKLAKYPTGRKYLCSTKVSSLHVHWAKLNNFSFRNVFHHTYISMS